MANNLTGYEKGARLIRIMAWLNTLAFIGINLSILIPMFVDKTFEQNSFEAIIVLVLTCAFLWFIFFLAKSVKEHKNWARIVGIIYGIILLIGFPIGTIIGGCLLWYLIGGWESPPTAVDK